MSRVCHIVKMSMTTMPDLSYKTTIPSDIETYRRSYEVTQSIEANARLSNEVFERMKVSERKALRLYERRLTLMSIDRSPRFDGKGDPSSTENRHVGMG